MMAFTSFFKFSFSNLGLFCDPQSAGTMLPYSGQSWQVETNESNLASQQHAEPTDGLVITERCLISLINSRNSFRSIYDSILLRHPFRDITRTLAFCERTDQSICNSATHNKHAHTHTNMSRPWYVRHASTTPENDLHPFSGLSFQQWCSPSGLPNL